MLRRISSRSRRPLALAITLAFAAGGAQAATITVDSNDDVAASPSCNLRSAIASINAAVAQPTCMAATTGTFGTSDTIVFAPAVANSTITMAQGAFAVTAPVTITGSGQTLDAHGGYYSVMSSTKDLGLSNITLTGGHPTTPGGGLYLSTATSSSVTLNNVSLSGNAAYSGGGLYSKGNVALTVQDSLISGNKSSSGAGGAFIRDATVTISGSRITNNNSNGRTGGILFGGEIATMDRTTIEGNNVTCGTNYCSAGVYIAVSQVTIGNSTISGNSADGLTNSKSYIAGGVYAYTSYSTFFNTTISGNSAIGGDVIAGAISEAHATGAYGIILTNATVSANSASTPNPTPTLISGGLTLGNGYYYGDSNAANTIISANTATISTGAATASDLGLASNGPTAAFQFSLLGTALSATFTGNSNVFNDTPGLGALANNGGPTKTMAVLTGSPALDAGSNALAVDASAAALTTDQTGGPRISGASVDIGAFEFNSDVIFANGFE